MSTATLTDASLQVRSTDVVATWTVSGEMPADGSWLLSTTLTGGEDGPIHQFGVKVVDGEHSGSFVFDHVQARQLNYPQVAPLRVGSKWTAVFPRRELDVATAGTWRATLTLDGVDVGHVDG